MSYFIQMCRKLIRGISQNIQYTVNCKDSVMQARITEASKTSAVKMTNVMVATLVLGYLLENLLTTYRMRHMDSVLDSLYCTSI